ncbi:DNA methyltransferase [Bradyrhizobium sp.]
MRKTSRNDENLEAVSFDDWVGGRTIESIGSNAGADALPFQGWRHFKEAFAPELIQRAVLESPIPVRRCLDPFGGSGTTAIACQFLGVRPTTIEVNPFLADLIEAKLARYDVRSLAHDFGKLVRAANRRRLNPAKFFASAPCTFVEPGVEGRWIFSCEVAARVAAYVAALPSIEDSVNQRLFRVLLGGILVGLSNVVISGKGRRYRRRWQERSVSAADVDEALCQSVETAVGDILRHAQRSEYRYSVLRGDARRLVRRVKSADLAVFSPPYPNSFDYTDVYNIELWALQYLNEASDNTALRTATLSSHVQIKRAFASPPKESSVLNRTIRALRSNRSQLWNSGIPDMVGAYFADMATTIRSIAEILPDKGQIWMVVGDSRYAGVSIPVADILSQLSASMGCRLTIKEPFRSMRTSAQQGGSLSLNETLLVLSRA